MPNPIYGWFEGQKQGKIEGWGSWPGEDDQTGREGASLIQQFNHEITIPRDAQSGLASGRRVHHPVQLVKRIDKSSPKLFQALCQGERFPKVEFKWFRIDPTGAGDTFAGGFLGYLAATGNRSPQAFRQATIFGSVMASFTVEAFSLDRLRVLDYKEIEARFKEFKRLTHFEDLPT